MIKQNCIDFLLSECTELVNESMIKEIVHNIFTDNSEESYSTFTNSLNDYANDNPVSIEYLILTLSNCSEFTFVDYDLEDVLSVICQFRPLESAQTLGNFLNHVFDKYNTFEEIKDADEKDMGIYHIARFSLLKQHLAEKEVLF